MGFLLISANAGAATLSMRTERNAVQAGEQFEVEIELSREADEPADGIRQPDFSKDFDVVGPPSTSSGYKLQIGMGPTLNVHTQTTTFTLRAKRPGVFVIPPAQARVAGRTIRSEQLTIRVGQPPAGTNADAPVFDRSLFLRATPSKADVFSGEAFLVEWHIYVGLTTALADQVNIRQAPAAPDFLVEELEIKHNARGFQRTVEGHPFQVHVGKRQILVPTKAGSLSVGPMSIETAVSMGFFRSKRIMRGSPALTIAVKPLPADGRPQGFQEANVGVFKLDAEWKDAALKIAANTGLTLRVTLAGEGSAKQVDVPAPAQSADYRVFPKVIEDNSARRESLSFRKVVEYTFVPTHGGTISIPGLAFDWFDVEAKRYRRATTPARNVEVEGGAPTVAAAAGSPTTVASGASARPPGATPIAPDQALIDPGNFLRPIRDGEPELASVSLFGDPALLIGTGALAPFVYIVVLVVLAIRRRREARAGEIAVRDAARNAQRALKALSRRPGAADAYAELERALYKFLQDRTGIAASGMTVDEVSRTLGTLGCSAEVGDDLARLIDACESARFAPNAALGDRWHDTLRLGGSVVERIAKVSAR